MTRRDYEVGYGRPPKHSRFNKGRSGNPRGRPRKSVAPPSDQIDLSEEIRQMLCESITITQDGQKVRVTKGQAMARQLYAKAVGGDMKAFTLLVRLASDNDNAPAAPVADPSDEAPTSESEEEIIARFLVRQNGPGTASGNSGGEHE
jgi:hypothetical protein